MENLLDKYEDPFTLDESLKVQPGVTREKVLEARKMLKAAQRSRVEEARLTELLTSSDLSYSIAHLLNIDLIPQLPKKLEDLNAIAPERKVKDFGPVKLRGVITGDGIEGAGVDEDGAAAVVPEGTPFPHVTVSNSEEAYHAKLRKRGLRADVTFEAIVDDALGEIEALPDAFLDVVDKTHHAEVFEALNKATLGLTAATLIDGSQIGTNAGVSGLAIIAAAQEIENREVNGNAIGSISGYNVFVAPGKKRFLEYDIAQMGRIREVHKPGTEGETAVTLVLAPDSALQALFPSITIIETRKLKGKQWRMLPKPGTTARPVLERLTLRGYEQAEIRVRNDQGYRPGGGQLGIWEGGFEADTASFRLRLFTGAALWDEKYVVKVDPA